MRDLRKCFKRNTLQSSFHFLGIWKAEEYENVSAESINKLNTNQTWHVKWNHCWVTFKSFQRNTYKYHFAAFWRNKSILFLFSQISTWCFLSARQWCIVFLIDTSFPSSDDFNFCWNNCEILFPASKEAIEKYKTVWKSLWLTSGWHFALSLANKPQMLRERSFLRHRDSDEVKQQDHLRWRGFALLGLHTFIALLTLFVFSSSQRFWWSETINKLARWKSW